MTDHYCEVCKQLFNGYTYTIEISDDKGKIHVTGHSGCILGLQTKIKSINGYSKLSVQQTLKAIKFNRD
jgi:hypothetical protein